MLGRRLVLALAAAAAAATTTTTVAWAPPAGRRGRGGCAAAATSTIAPTPTALRVGQGWDNDDYLRALSGAPADRDAATDDYFAQSRFGRDLERMTPPPPPTPDADIVGGPGAPDEIPADGAGTKGAVITDEMKRRIKEQNERDLSQGGRMFQELMARAQQGQPRAAPPPPTPTTTTTTPPPMPAAPPVSPAGLSPQALEGLTVEQQAELFRQMVAGGGAGYPPPHPQMPPPLPTATGGINTLPPFPQAYPPQGAVVASDGRRIGRNRDADQIQNSADLYFAQLKRDSAIRKEAWLRGDRATADAVFADPSIQEIEERVSPFLEERKRLEQAGLETSEDEMIMMGGPWVGSDSRPDKPADYSGISYKEKMQQLREKRNAGSGGSTSVSLPSPTSAAVAPAPKAPTTPQASVTAAPPPPVPAVSVPKPDPLANAASAPGPGTQAAPPSEDDKRSDIRTLMGLLLKHRGGPGFGAGRLTSDRDIDLFQSLSRVLVQVLKEEGVSTPAAVDTVARTPAAGTLGAGAGGATAQKVNSLIIVLEGAITLYRTSPSALRESVLGVLRAGLDSAIASLNEIIGNSDARLGEQPSAPSTTSSDERVSSMISCIEAACQIYKNSPPELHQAVLVTLRAAFLSALGTLNEVMAGGADPPGVPAPPVPSAPAATSATAQPTYSGTDKNSKFFQGVYSKLEAAKGDGKMGLREDLGASEAIELADSIAEMRTRLVDELENGIDE